MFRESGRIFGVNRDGTDLQSLVTNIDVGEGNSVTWTALHKDWRNWSIENLLPEDDEHILVKSTSLKGMQSVSKLNIYSGEMQVLYDGNKHKINNWVMDGKGVLRIASRTKKGATSFYRFDSKADRLSPLTRTTDYSFAYDGKTFLKNRSRILSAAPDSNEVFIAENVTSDRFSIAKYNFENNKSSTILSDPVFDIGQRDSGYELYQDEYSDRVLGVGYHAEKWRVVWFDEAMQTIQKKLDQHYPTKNQHHIHLDQRSKQDPIC